MFNYSCSPKFIRKIFLFTCLQCTIFFKSTTNIDEIIFPRLNRMSIYTTYSTYIYIEIIRWLRDTVFLPLLFIHVHLYGSKIHTKSTNTKKCTRSNDAFSDGMTRRGHEKSEKEKKSSISVWSYFRYIYQSSLIPTARYLQWHWKWKLLHFLICIILVYAAYSLQSTKEISEILDFLICWISWNLVVDVYS